MSDTNGATGTVPAGTDEIGDWPAMQAARSNTHRIIVEAYAKGYRVTDEGVLIGLKGELDIVLRKGQRYPTFSVSTRFAKSKVYGLPVHRLAAFCFYGIESFSRGMVCRHLNADVMDVSRRNIVLGTHSQNNMDKPEHVRISAARKARAAQGAKPCNTILTKEMLEEIYAIPVGSTGRAKRGSASALAVKFGVSSSTVSMAFRGDTHGQK